MGRGRRFEAISVMEVDHCDKTPIIRAYLDKWEFEVGKFFEGLTANSTDTEIAAIASGFPVFRIIASSPTSTLKGDRAIRYVR